MTMNLEPDVYFREEQRFHQPWLWALIFIPTLGITAGVFYVVLQQLVFGRPFGDEPLSDIGLLLLGALLIFIQVALCWLFWALRLETVLRKDGLFVRFHPFHRIPRRVPLEKMLSHSAVTYSPLWEYGGWGIRYSMKFKGKAYNVSGNRGVRIEFTNGKHILIGSNRADELNAAMPAVLAEARQAALSYHGPTLSP